MSPMKNVAAEPRGLTGVHQPGDSHFELLRAFAADPVLDRASATLSEHGYRAHEFGDSMLIDARCLC
jgi:S-adenosylmethionine:tRNA ribosyltransferase-isomerase